LSKNVVQAIDILFKMVYDKMCGREVAGCASGKVSEDPSPLEFSLSGTRRAGFFRGNANMASLNSPACLAV
jgi:hypothetical protein